jgi:hypothetical protein
MNESTSQSKPAEQPKRKPYVKPSIEKIHLVPQETVLGSCFSEIDCNDEIPTMG